MTGFGIGLAIFALVIALVGLIKLLAWVDRVHEQGLPSLLTVKHYESNTADVMSRASNEASRTERTNDRTNEGSSHDQLWQEFRLDRTRKRLIAVMVDSDLTVSEIRGLLKGTSETVGEEIEAERQSQGKPAAQSYRTPIAGRPTNAQFHDPELSYQPPPK